MLRRKERVLVAEMSIADGMIERNYVNREGERERKWRERNWVDKKCERSEGVNGCMPSTR